MTLREKRLLTFSRKPVNSRIPITQAHSIVLWRRMRPQSRPFPMCSSLGRVITLNVTAYAKTASVM